MYRYICTMYYGWAREGKEVSAKNTMINNDAMKRCYERGGGDINVAFNNIRLFGYELR